MSGISTSGSNGTIIVSGPDVLQISDFYVRAGILHPLAVGSTAVIVSTQCPIHILVSNLQKQHCLLLTPSSPTSCHPESCSNTTSLTSRECRYSSTGQQ